MKKQGQKIAGLILLFLFCAGCALLPEFGPRPGTVVEMPRPSEQDQVEEKEPPVGLNVDEENVEKIIEGLILPEAFTWKGTATYLTGDKKRAFLSSVSVDGDRFFVEVSEDDRVTGSALCDGEVTYTLRPSGEVVQKTAVSGRFTYQTIAMAASVGAVLPTDRVNRKAAYLSEYNGKNCLFAEIQNEKILEKYYLDVEWGYPLRVECFFSDELVYTFDTQSFSEGKPDPALFELPG